MSEPINPSTDPQPLDEAVDAPLGDAVIEPGTLGDPEEAVAIPADAPPAPDAVLTEDELLAEGFDEDEDDEPPVESPYDRPGS